jgi:hypothetical protein
MLLMSFLRSLRGKNGELATSMGDRSMSTMQVTWTCAGGAMFENGAVFLVLASLAVGVSLFAAGFITGGQ